MTLKNNISDLSGAYQHWYHVLGTTCLHSHIYMRESIVMVKTVDVNILTDFAYFHAVKSI
jgi:hypothetical protein